MKAHCIFSLFAAFSIYITLLHKLTCNPIFTFNNVYQVWWQWSNSIIVSECSSQLKIMLSDGC